MGIATKLRCNIIQTRPRVNASDLIACIVLVLTADHSDKLHSHQESQSWGHTGSPSAADARHLLSSMIADKRLIAMALCIQGRDPYTKDVSCRQRIGKDVGVYFD